MNVTIVLSSPRSGSSWLSRIVRRVDEIDVFTHNTFTTQFLYALYPLRAANPWSDDGVSRRRVFDRLLDPVRLHLVRSQIRRRHKRQRVVILSPTLSGFMPLLRRAFPDANYVHFQRNPLDTIASMQRFLAKNALDGFWQRYRNSLYGGRFSAFRNAAIHAVHQWRWRRVPHAGYLGARPEGFQQSRRLGLVQFLSWYYVANQRDIINGLDAVDESNQLSIHYENVVSEYDKELSKLFGFVFRGDRIPEIPKPHDGVKPGSVGRHNTAYNEQERRLILSYLSQHAPTEVLEPYALCGDCQEQSEVESVVAG